MKDDRSPDPRALDVAAFCRHATHAHGQAQPIDLPRLAESVVALPAAASWTADGSTVPVSGGTPELWLQLQGSVEVEAACQRCLQPVSLGLKVDRRFRFVATDEEAERLDEVSEDDVMVLVPRLDLLSLLEDELILGLPIVPMHEQCPQPLALAGAPDEGAADDARPNPFAALAALRGKVKSGGNA